MRLQNILALTNAKLLNEPFVSVYEDITFNVSKIKRGDVFIAYDIEEIPQAISNGAYAILFDKPTQIQDNEVAWIKVDSLDNALLRLLRFKLIQQEIQAYKCDEIVLKLSFCIETFNDIISIKGDIKEHFLKLWNVKKSQKILFCSKFSFENLFTNSIQLQSISKKKINIIEKTLYETSFIYDNTYYERVMLSPFFIPFLEQLLNFYDSLHVKYKVKNFDNIDNFEILFVNKKFEIKEYGSSEFVLIFEKNLELIQKEMEFLSNYAPWAKIYFILPISLKNNSIKNCIYYQNKNEILNLLQKIDFHFAFIAGCDKNILKKFSFTTKQLTFDLI